MVMARKYTGAKLKKEKKKRKAQLKGKPRVVKLGKENKKVLRTLGGNPKEVLFGADKANVFDPKTKKTKLVVIKNVIEDPSKRFLARSNVIVKSAIIDTEIGKARVTNRPSQEGNIQAVLIE